MLGLLTQHRTDIFKRLKLTRCFIGLLVLTEFRITVFAFELGLSARTMILLKIISFETSGEKHFSVGTGCLGHLCNQF